MAVLATRNWGNYRFTIETSTDGDTQYISVTNVYTDEFTDLIVRLMRTDNGYNQYGVDEHFPPNSSGFASASWSGMPAGAYAITTVAEPDGTVSDPLTIYAPPLLRSITASCGVNPNVEEKGVISFIPYLAPLQPGSYFVMFWNEDTNKEQFYSLLDKNTPEIRNDLIGFPDGRYSVFLSKTRLKSGLIGDITPVTVLCTAPIIRGCTDPAATNYNVAATEDDGTCQYPPVPVPGCTDATATNYNPAATINDGTCTYPAKAVIPFFDVPLMNSLRFIVPTNPDYLIRFPNYDNTLLCDFKLRGVKNPGYYQKVEKQDAFTIQFRSNYSAHTVKMLSYETDEVLDTYSAAKKISNTSRTLQFTTILKAHSGGTKTRVYFEQHLFNFEIDPSQVLSITNTGGGYDGRYAITGINQDSAAANPYFIINKPFTGPGETVEASALAEYDIFPYDVWEVDLDFAAVPTGAVYAVIEASDPVLGADIAIGEPINLQTRHEETVMVKYRNRDNWCDIDYTTGIYHYLRFTGNLYKPTTGGEREIHRNSNGAIIKLNAQKRRVLTLEAYMVPAWMHEKLGVVFDYDIVYINGVEYQTDEAYKPDYLDRYALANGSIEVEQVQWFGNTNNSHDAGDIDEGGGRIIANGGYLKY